MRAWRCSKGTLVDLGPTRTAVLTDLMADLPEGPWRDLHEFRLVETGENFEVSAWSLDDDLCVCVHAVVDGALKELTLIQHYGREWTSRHTVRIVLDSLEPAPDR
jgi:hypothetical protein